MFHIVLPRHIKWHMESRVIFPLVRLCWSAPVHTDTIYWTTIGTHPYPHINSSKKHHKNWFFLITWSQYLLTRKGLSTQCFTIRHMVHNSAFSPSFFLRWVHTHLSNSFSIYFLPLDLGFFPFITFGLFLIKPAFFLFVWNRKWHTNLTAHCLLYQSVTLTFQAELQKCSLVRSKFYWPWALSP